MDKMIVMTVNGSILIAIIICFRQFFSHQMPKRFLVCLWICVIVRLLLTVSIPVSWPEGSPWNAGAVSASHLAGSSFHVSFAHDPLAAEPFAYLDGEKIGYTAVITEEIIIWLKELLFCSWLLIAVLLAIWMIVKHVKSLRWYGMSLPVCEEKAAEWLRTHRSFRKITLRESEFVRSPMTYGMIHPVILLPSEMNISEEEFLCIMEHEWIHIRRWDILVKYLLYATVCIYWFHPLVWIMSILLNRDMEMACDEEVVKKCSDGYKKTYARVLIRLAEGRRPLIWPVNACFARHSEMEERVRWMMRTKKYSWKTAVLAVVMICCTILTFTVCAQDAQEIAAETETFSDADRKEQEKPKAEIKKTESIQSDPVDQAGEQSAAQEQVVALAEKYLGAPYKWGGTDLTDGVDSVGFVKAIYAQAGMELPADIHELIADKKQITLSELCAGDIVIYRAVVGDDDHAAIYDGNEQVIHASNLRDGVKRSDLNYREIKMAIRIFN